MILSLWHSGAVSKAQKIVAQQKKRIIELRVNARP
jgi:hypothetical protein